MKRVLICLLTCCFFLTGANLLTAQTDDPDPVIPPGGKTRVSGWVKQLESEDIKQRRLSMVALKIAGPKPRAVIPAVCGVLAGDKDASLRIDAAMLLGEFAPKALETKVDMREGIEALITALTGAKADADERVRKASAESLGKFKDENIVVAVQALIDALKDQPDVQVIAADSIDRLGDLADKATNPMLDLLKNPEAHVLARCSAVTFLSRLELGKEGSGGKEVGGMKVIVDALKDTKADPRLRKTAADALGRYKTDAASATAILAAAFRDENVELKIAAGSALARVGGAAKEALPQVKEALKDSNVLVRNRAVDIIAKLGPDAAELIPDLTTFLRNEKNQENIVAALRAFAAMGSLAKPSVGLIAEFKGNPTATIREAAIDTLKKVEGQ